MPGPAIHLSATCLVVFAIDTAAGGRPVALKLMRHRHQFEAEVAARVVNGVQLPRSAVIGVLGWHTPVGQGLTDELGQREEPEPTPCPAHPLYDEYPYVLALEPGDRSLHDVCNKERMAGYDLSAIVQTVREIAAKLGQLHGLGVVHGDLKQRKGAPAKPNALVVHDLFDS